MPDLLTAGIGLGTLLIGSQAAKTPDMPVIQPPPVMPVANDATVQAAKRRSLLAQTQRRGRQSTILTGQRETLG